MAKQGGRKERVKDWGDCTNTKDYARKAWHFLWYEDTVASWAVNIIVAFVLIKFLFYPGMGLVLGTKFPVVAVVSSSMEHHPRSFDEWWVASTRGDGTNEDFYLRYNITKLDFLNYPFRNGFNKGDIMVLRGVKTATLAKGTVIVYWSGKPYPIIHRYIGNNDEKGMSYLMSKGDNNPRMLTGLGSPDLDERHIPQSNILGQAFLRIPYLGWVKIFAVNLYTCTAYGSGPQQCYSTCLVDGRQYEQNLERQCR